ncbi:TPA: type IV secretion system protein [Campylobacter jejuni]|nr:type IV secretion system protein [Campylobacter jejuni]HEF3938479.1 type IV secretion system protein [Campylobacter jejuni]
MNLFQTLGISVEEILNTIRTIGVSDRISQLAVLLSIIITIVIMYKGFEVLAGRSQAPIRDLTWDIAGKLLAITFALNIGGWLDLAINAMDGIYEWAGGGTTMYKSLDELFENTIKLTKTIWDKASFGDSIIAVIGMVLCYLGFAITVVPVLAILFVASFTQTLLVISAPIAFWLLIFKSTKNVFTQWVGLLLSNTLVVLLVGLFAKTFINQIRTWINSFSIGTGDGSEILSTAVFFVIASIVLVVMIVATKVFAEKVASVSMEGAMGGAMRSTLNPAGRLAGKALGWGSGKAVNAAGTASKYAGKGIAAGSKLATTGATSGYSFAKRMYERMRNA